MTQPKQAKQVDGKRVYTLPSTGEEFFSVTTVLGVLNKPAIPPWASKKVAEYVAANWKKLVPKLWDGVDTRQAAINEMKGAPWKERDAAADLGDHVHAAADAHIKGEQLDWSYIPVPAWDYIRQFFKFLEDFEPEITHSEGTVYNRFYGYAGSFDFLAQMGSFSIIDIKTGKGVYPETALQLNAYAHAEFIGSPDGIEEKMPKVEQGYVLHLQPDKYSLIPIEINMDHFLGFTDALGMFRWQQGAGKAALGKPVSK